MSACPLCGGTGRWVFWALGRSAARPHTNTSGLVNIACPRCVPREEETMTDTTRKQVHDLLDRVIDSDPAKMGCFRLDYFSCGEQIGLKVEMAFQEQEFKERCTLDAFPAVVGRALEATAS